jgi:hypothetical protein
LYARAVDEDGSNHPALVNLARLELQAGYPAIAAARLQTVMKDTRNVDATRYRQFLAWTHDAPLDQTEINEHRLLLRDTLWYQAAYNLAVAQLDDKHPESAVWTISELCSEMESALAALRTHHTPLSQAQPIEAVLHRLRGPSIVLLAEITHKALPALTPDQRERLRIELLDLARRVAEPSHPSPQATFDELTATLVGTFRDDATASSLTHYNISSYDTSVRSYGDAIAQLRLAVSGSPDIIARAENDPSLMDLREHRRKDFLTAIGRPLPPWWKRIMPTHLP